ncbi:hypothetical protein [Cellulosimicrobium arenosum]|uniref:Uncharacterized protein n=1 Tax=Cellulosimicrobium arenosum TaxID=2708133 RepID=A0A927J143_9MICO|nr:hypothetical protein [Cellulosimicrobium arenosum]MBD8079857.1 hypothetical protein [Cellulosimicrobium arenosum]
MTDVMKQLQAADPVRRADLDAVDAATFTDLRTAIPTDVPDSPAAGPITSPAGPRRHAGRVGRRGAVAIGLAAVLTGGGVAYAAIHAFRGADGEGVSCVSAWDADDGGEHVDAAGPWLTGDPYADCATLLAEQGLPPIDDPVAFAYDGQTFVAPADQVPDGVERLEGSSAVAGAVVELQSSATDLVDGGRSGCRTLAEGVAWAEDEVDRLGLQDWTVTAPELSPGEGATADPGLPCSYVEVHVGDRTVVVTSSDDPAEALASPEIDPVVAALRQQVADRCVTLDEARAVVDDVLTSIDDEFPTTSVTDESARCARVDLAVGGSVQATVYGPATAG